MDINTAESKRTLQFYRWAMSDFEREIIQDFAILETIKTPSVRADIEILRSRAESERLTLAAAHVKRWHSEAVALAGEILTPEEVALTMSWLDDRTALSTQLRKELLEDFTRSGERLLTKLELKSIVTRKLTETLGARAQRGPGQPWTYMMRVGDWEIETSLDLRNRRIPELEYWHRVYRIDTPFSDRDTRHSSHASTNILSWLGLGQTRWIALREQDAYEAANSAVLIIMHFIEAMRPILAGLAIDGP